MKKLLFSLLIMFGFVFNIYALDSFDLNKTVKKNDVKYDRNVEVTLSIKANAPLNDITKDIVLVIDRSSSMNNEMKNTKEKLKTLIDNVVNDKTKLGIVVFGTETISTTNLTNDKESLKGTITSIKDKLIDEGTNIEAGLKSAYDLLKDSSAQNKVVILLTDGEATFYYDDGVLKGDGSSYSSKGEEKAKEYLTLLKNNNVIIYNIGFKIKEDSKADKFLKESADKYYLSKDINELEKDLKNISEEIRSVSVSNEVIDIVPSNFKIISLSLANQELLPDGRTKIIWQIPSIEIDKEYKLTYTLEAKESDYGSMYTNEIASLTGTYVENHPLYTSEEFKLYFNKPYAPIPMVTKDDNYIEKESKIITITNSILDNDSYIINNNESKSIKNKFNIYDLSCGKNLVINEDGSFSIDNDNCKNISFAYSVTSYVNYGEFVEVESNKAKVNINLISKNSYVVKYLDIDTSEDIIDFVINDSYLGEKVEEEYVDILNYTLVNDKKQSIEITDGNNEIVFYYKKNLGKYCVEYYYDSVLDDTLCLEGVVGDKIEKYEDKNRNGYTLTKVENLPLIIDGNNKIKVYYNSVNESIPNTSVKKSNYSLIFIIVGAFLFIKRMMK